MTRNLVFRKLLNSFCQERLCFVKIVKCASEQSSTLCPRVRVIREGINCFPEEHLRLIEFAQVSEQSSKLISRVYVGRIATNELDPINSAASAALSATRASRQSAQR